MSCGAQISKISEDESIQKTDILREESIGEILQHLEVMSEDKIVLAHNLLKDKNYENEDEIGVDAKREILFNELAKYMKNQDYAGAMGDIWPYIRNKIYCWCNLLMKIKSVPYMVKLVKIHALVSQRHKKSKLSGWQNLTRKNFRTECVNRFRDIYAAKVRKSLSRHICAKVRKSLS